MEIKQPDWMFSTDDEEDGDENDSGEKKALKSPKPKPDPKKLANLIQRRKVYGDITQNATEKQIERLLVSIMK